MTRSECNVLHFNVKMNNNANKSILNPCKIAEHLPRGMSIEFMKILDISETVNLERDQLLAGSDDRHTTLHVQSSRECVNFQIHLINILHVFKNNFHHLHCKD